MGLAQQPFQGLLLAQRIGASCRGLASSAGKEGNGLEDNRLNLIQPMEIFDYTNVIYYAKLPFLTNGCCFDKWDYNRRGFSRQTNPAGSLPMALFSVWCALDTDPGRMPDRKSGLWLGSVKPGRVTLSTSFLASITSHSLTRRVFIFPEHFNVHRKLHVYNLCRSS